ncbi:MAG: hypothetical protein JO132_06485 [Streptosporangiaceae bacterium]|nr:hypothetical protein [Streptosporangiaceae bacterium]
MSIVGQPKKAAQTSLWLSCSFAGSRAGDRAEQQRADHPGFTERADAEPTW